MAVRIEREVRLKRGARGHGRLRQGRVCAADNCDRSSFSVSTLACIPPLIILLLFLVCSSVAVAGQGHENCSMCHRAHTAKDLALFPESLTDEIMNPHTGEKMDKIDALCMKCHALPPYGKGIRVIDPQKKHPFGIEPVMVKLPEKADGFGGLSERLTCMGCHDPHPSNQNIGYLRVPSETTISRSEDIIKSCLWCHPNMKSVFDVLPKTPHNSTQKKKKKRQAPPSGFGGIGF
ncbi:MAG: hypothetical protein ACMUIL_04275 [bacterium]